MKHLGERVTSFVDGQLGDNARDQILAHLTRCATCRDSVGDERAVKAALHGLRDVEPSPDFVAELHAIAEPGGPLPPPRRPFPAAAAAVASWRTTAGSGQSTAGRRGRPVVRRSARVAVGAALSAGALTVLLAGLGTSGAPDTQPGEVEPEFDRFSMEHARSAGTLPFLDPAAVLVSVVPGGQPGTHGVFPMGPDQ